MARPDIQVGKIITIRVAEHQSAQGTFVRWKSPEIAVIDAGGREISGEPISGNGTNLQAAG